MKFKLIATILLLIIPIFYELFRRTNELDYLHYLSSGKLTM